MSNKNLLNESTIRKFMKLANMEPLAEEFVSAHLQTEDEEVELEEATEETVEEEAIEEGDYMGKEDEPEMDMADEEMPMDDEPMDMEDEEMGGDAEVTLDETDVEALRDALAAAQSVMDKLAGGLAGGEEMDMEPEMEEEPMDMDMGEPEMEEEPAMRDMMDEAEEEIDVDLVDENELVAEVLKKVVNRLAKKG